MGHLDALWGLGNCKTADGSDSQSAWQGGRGVGRGGGLGFRGLGGLGV